MNLSQGLYSDDGKELLPPASSVKKYALPPLPATPIRPSTVVGDYKYDTTIDWVELGRLVDARKALGKEQSDADLAKLKVPNENLFSGWCIDVWPVEDQSFDDAYEGYCDGLRRDAAAELAVLRELRDKRIGISKSISPSFRIIEEDV